MDLSPATLNRSDIRVLDSKLCPKVRYCTLSTIIHAQYIHYKYFEEFEHELLCLSLTLPDTYHFGHKFAKFDLL